MSSFGFVLWRINHFWLSIATSTLFIYIKYMIWLGSTVVGYLNPNPFYTYISNIYDLVWLVFIALSVIQCQILFIYIYILDIYDLVWLGFIAYQLL